MVDDSLWEQAGGTDSFVRLVEIFYARIQQDPDIAWMYPQQDWEGAKWRLRTFLEQYWGGPRTYSEKRGNPRLILRHKPYPITRDIARKWLHHMFAALDEMAFAPMIDTAMRDYFTRAAGAMINTADDVQSLNITN